MREQATSGLRFKSFNLGIKHFVIELVRQGAISPLHLLTKAPFSSKSALFGDAIGRFVVFSASQTGFVGFQMFENER